MASHHMDRSTRMCVFVWSQIWRALAGKVGWDGGGVGIEGQGEHVPRDNCISLTSPVTLYRPSRAPQWAHTGVLERAMSLITGVAVTWVPSTKMACLTAAPSGSQCKCEVTPRHLGIHVQERFHGCMHWCTSGTLTHGHAHTHTHAPVSTDFWGTWKSCRHKHSPQSFNSCQSALTPLWKEHALIQGALIIHMLLLRTLKGKQKVERARLRRKGLSWNLLIKEWK